MFLGEEDNLVLQEIGEHQNKSNQTISFGGGGEINLLMETEYFPEPWLFPSALHPGYPMRL